MEKSPKELFFESEELKAAGKKKKEAVPVRSLPHTEESREEEERVNPPGRSGGRGYATPFLNVEDIADSGMNPEEELIAKEEGRMEAFNLSYDQLIQGQIEDEEYKNILRLKRDYPNYYEHREKWEELLQSLHDQAYAQELREEAMERSEKPAAFLENQEDERQGQVEKQVPESVLNQSKLGKVTYEAFGWDARKMTRDSKQVGKELRGKRKLPKSLKERRRVRKLKSM